MTINVQNDKDEILRAKAASEILGLNPRTLIRWVDSGKYIDLLKPLRRNKMLVFRRSAIEAFLEASLVKQA